MRLPRFRLRTLMIAVAVVGICLWAAIVISRAWTTMRMMSSEFSTVVLPAYWILFLAVVVALSLIAVGIIVLGLRIRVILRDSSPRSGRTQPDD